ncbi:hypothetical protein TNCV_4396221 [Trichonephila clavipes]|uniref:Uncharacterized protein n=1 Tax=Trichonephila clavipes TaxID=2585209 RepID=A0A8X6W4Y1_TRICX|nr:hypothetical protein TNCV_4396221 [Trichonephila clavipes]
MPFSSSTKHVFCVRTYSSRETLPAMTTARAVGLEQLISDHYPFKSCLGSHFTSFEEVQAKTETLLKSLPKPSFQNCYHCSSSNSKRGPPKSIPTTENEADCSTRRAGNGGVT